MHAILLRASSASAPSQLRDAANFGFGTLALPAQPGFRKPAPMVALSFAEIADEPVASAVASPTVWVLHDGKPGMASQALGLAEATGLPFIEKPLAIRNPWACLPPQLWLAPLRPATPAAI